MKPSSNEALGLLESPLMESSSPPGDSELPSGLEPLVRQLAALPVDERQKVVAAAEREAASAATGDVDSRRRARWQRLRALAGVVDIGGNALEDGERLYDG
jgi:hypothetical protein